MPPPIPSHPGGFYETPFQLTLSTDSDNTNIYYTNDGSTPDTSSSIYRGPIDINATQVIRTIAVKSGYNISPIHTATFFINVHHSFPVISLSGDADTFFDQEKGFYTNFTDNIEVPANVEFYESNGVTGFNQPLEVEIHGSTSAVLSQKSLALKAKESLGKSTIDYPVFPEEIHHQYRSLILRNSGQDWEYTMFRDALQSSLTRDLSDLAIDIQVPDLDGQAFRPVIAFINGQYWGIYNLRERLDWRYLKVHYGLEKDEIDLIENLNDAKEGDFEAWNKLDSLLRTKSFDGDQGLEELANLADLDHFMDYMVFNIFVDNTDWPGNNFRRWRERSKEGKWRWMTKDLDYAFGFAEFGTDNFNTGDPTVNSLDRMLNPTFFYPNPKWATRLFNKLMENKSWKNKFINRMADQLNVLYQPARLLDRIDAFRSLYLPEMEKQNQRWNNVWTWEKDVEVLRTFAKGRSKAVRDHFKNSIADISGMSEITINAVPATGGKIKINTITADASNFPWTGTYFNGIDLPLEAIPNPGYKFVGWSDQISETQSRIITSINEKTSVTAFFVKQDEETLNQEINFPPITDKIVTEGAFPISATASSGLPVRFKILSGPATIKENRITLDGLPGIVFVEANQDGNEQYNPARPVTQSFEIKNNPLSSICPSKGEHPWHEYIARVSLKTLDNISFKEGYGDFSQESTQLLSGSEYEIKLSPGFSYFQWDEYFQV